jgi:DDE superfamily endonuclease
MVVGTLPPEFTPWLAALAQHRHGRLAWRLAPLLVGVLFARGRRTVASWLRAAGLGQGFPAWYYFVARVGQAAEGIAASRLRLLLGALPVGDRLVLSLDDTPTQRYGPKVQGAGVHHKPTPGPAGPKFLYGHVWVTLAWLLRQPRWGALGLPRRALLYVRRKDLPAMPARYGWAFQTKLELAVPLVRWLVRWARLLGQPLWVVTDGG